MPVHPLPDIHLIPSGYNIIGADSIIACVNDTIVLDAGDDNDPQDMIYNWSNNWGGRYLTAKTNGNWIDWQSYTVEVTNPYTSCVNNAEITILFSYNECELGTTEIDGGDEFPFRIKPNPSRSGIFSFEGDKNLASLEIQVFDAGGALLLEKNYQGLNGTWSKNIDLSAYSTGVYFILIKADNETYSLRVVKN